MSYIELDHTSSGVQIAAALARDESSATIVNINGGSAKRDIYNEVVAASNKGFKALGSPVRLTRADVKKAVIATIYGGTHKTVYEAFQVATGLGFKGNEEVYRVFKAAIDDKLKGVVTVQRYFEYIAKEVHATGASGVTLALASGAEFYVRFRSGEGVISKSDVSYTNGKGESRAFITDVTYNNGKDNVIGTAKELVAGFVQAFDAEVLARVQVRLAEAGIRFFSKHDAYLIEERHRDELTEIVKRVFFEVFSVDHLAALREDVQARYGIELEPFDAYGRYDVTAVLGSNYLVSQ